jgi:hypothetical protein
VIRLFYFSTGGAQDVHTQKSVLSGTYHYLSRGFTLYPFHWVSICVIDVEFFLLNEKWWGPSSLVTGLPHRSFEESVDSTQDIPHGLIMLSTLEPIHKGNDDSIV